MRVERFFDQHLAQASYVVVSEHEKVAMVVDPNRDADQYIDAAAADGLRITDVTETHIHADFVSGARDLARRTGARLHLSDAGGPDWKYAFAGSANANLLADGSQFMVGEVRIDAMHTPGHTPEHLTFLVTDTSAADEPMGAITGDFIFVGDVGRPDLLEMVAGIAGTKEGSARDLFKSLQEFKKRPDYLQIWPGHGAGSACGKALGAMPQSTLGYERLFNWGLAETDENTFVSQVLSGQPDPPAYFAIMKKMNRDGAPARPSSTVRLLTAAEIGRRIRDGEMVIDTRIAADFAARHGEGTINLPWTKSFLTYGGTLLPYDRDLFLIVGEGSDATKIVDDLSLIGLDRIAGFHYLGSGQLDGIPMTSTSQLSIETLAETMPAMTILDVRRDDEWNEGHIPGATHIPLGLLAERLSELPRDREIAVHCQGGTRSAIAASILEKNGITASNVPGGFGEWARNGHPIVKD